MSAAAPTAEAEAPAKPKSKKLLFILIGVVVLALIGAGGALYILKKNTADENTDEEVVTEHKAHDAHSAPTFLPLDSMVVNLADPGGNRFVQVGITLQLQDTETGDNIKLYMPSIRNGILILISQRTADEILRIQGKERLANDIINEISHVMGYPVDDPASGEKKRRTAPNPVQGVLFSSFIVQ